MCEWVRLCLFNRRLPSPLLSDLVPIVALAEHLFQISHIFSGLLWGKFIACDGLCLTKLALKPQCQRQILPYAAVRLGIFRSLS